MKQLTILVRPITAEAVLRVLSELDVNACLVQEAKGYSRQKDYLERYPNGYTCHFPRPGWVLPRRTESVAR